MRLRGGTITVPPLSASAPGAPPPSNGDSATTAGPSVAHSDGCSGICPSRARAVRRDTAREYFF